MNMLPGSSLTGICANAVNGFAKVKTRGNGSKKISNLSQVAMQEGKALNLRVHEFLIVSRVVILHSVLFCFVFVLCFLMLMRTKTVLG